MVQPEKFTACTYIFREALEEIQEGIPINGVRLNNIRYADDTIVFADSIEALQQLIDKIVETSSRYGLEINTQKTKLMVISKEKITGTHLYINHTRIERVKQYTFPGNYDQRRLGQCTGNQMPHRKSKKRIQQNERGVQKPQPNPPNKA
ncbi:hypothetical protein WDU94_003263 [Cyamophila willieti]